MTEKQIMRWYNENLFSMVNKAIESKKEKIPSLIYTVDWLMAIAYRETWTLVNKYAEAIKFVDMLTLIKGDYSKRPGEPEKSYHGFGFWQIDVGSYPDFIKSGDWKDPYKCCLKAIGVLEEKRLWLFGESGKFDADFSEEEYRHRMITAAYNCGQGNVRKAVLAKLGVDYYTHEKNYSAMVWQYRELYNSLT